MRDRQKMLDARFFLIILCALCLALSDSLAPGRLPAEATRPWEPPVTASHPDLSHFGWMHGTQYWLNPGVTAEMIERDFRTMAEEDQINYVRLAMWQYFPGIPGERMALDYPTYDACFDAAQRHGIKITLAMPQIPGYWLGGADDPANRERWRTHIQGIVRRFKDKPALALWTVELESIRGWGALDLEGWSSNPGARIREWGYSGGNAKTPASAVTQARLLEWLHRRYPTMDAYRRAHPGTATVELTTESLKADRGLWNRYQTVNDWVTFNCAMNADMTHFMTRAVREIDPIHPVSATPIDIIANEYLEQGRNMWWTADTVDVPSYQMETHIELEAADMPLDVFAGQAATIRKCYCASRERGVSLTGEFLAGQEAGEAFRLYTPTGAELVATDIIHLAEGSKGLLYWLWNPLSEGPNAGLWSLREIDKSPSERSGAVAAFGKMIKTNNELLFGMKPADTHVAIYNSMDGGIFLAERVKSDPAFKWYAQNQLGFFKALRKAQVGCDFIDLRALRAGRGREYACLYVPFSGAMTEEEGAIFRQYVEAGGTILCDAWTAFSQPNAVAYPVQPGAGLDEVLGLRANASEVVHEKTDLSRVYDLKGRPMALGNAKIFQTVRPTTARVLARDGAGRPLITINAFGKGHALWTGTLLGLSAHPAGTDPARYTAIADLVRPYLPQPAWSIQAPPGTIVCRRLASDRGDLYVLLNENRTRVAQFTLRAPRAHEGTELLRPERPGWRAKGKGRLAGTLNPWQAAVILIRR